MRYLKSAAGRTAIAEALIVLFTAACAWFLLGSDGTSSVHSVPGATELAFAGGFSTHLAPSAPASAVDGSAARSDAPSNPWTQSQTIKPAVLAKELQSSTASAKPIVICVAPRALYNGAHIPGALFFGPGYTSQGIDSLRNWAKSALPAANVVIYCGCCPLDRCPNVRPAFSALAGMGFTHLRVLLLQHDFRTDWVIPGFPIEKSLSQ